METNICREMREFLSEQKISARKLGIEAKVNPVIITRILAGVRRDMNSGNADAIRDAMQRLRVQAAAQKTDNADETHS